MSAVYFLPCECGAKVRVTKAQAGQTVVCGCGKALEAPTIRGFQSLDVAEEQADADPGWSPLRGAALVGGIVLLLASASAYAGYLGVRPNVRPVRTADATAADIALESSLDEFRAQEEAPLSIFDSGDPAAALENLLRTAELLKLFAMSAGVVGGLLVGGSLLVQSGAAVTQGGSARG